MSVAESIFGPTLWRYKFGNSTARKWYFHPSKGTHKKRKLGV